MRSHRCKFNIKTFTVQCHYSALPFTHTKLIGDWLVICIYSCGSHLPSGERFGDYSSAKVAHIHLVLYSAHQCATPTFHRLAHMWTHFPATPLLSHTTCMTPSPSPSYSLCSWYKFSHTSNTPPPSFPTPQHTASLGLVHCLPQSSKVSRNIVFEKAGHVFK